MFEAEGHSYYKVLIPYGTEQVEGSLSVPETCQMSGMKAVCFGSPGCQFNSERCLVAPLIPTSCGIVNGISRLSCIGQSAGKCAEANKFF